MKSLDVIILVGGLGTRLRDTVPDVPKPLAQISETPFLTLLLDQLAHYEWINSVILAVGYKAEKIVDLYCNHDYSFDIIFSHENMPLGTGGALRNAYDKITTDSVMVMNGDSFLKSDLSGLYECHRCNNNDVTITLIQFEDTSRYGTVEIDGYQRILSFREKTENNNPGLINAGIYIFKREIILSIETGKKLSLEHNFFNQISSYKGYGWITNGKFIDIGTKESYAESEDFFRGHTNAK